MQIDNNNKLGFGLMRLPGIRPLTDIKTTSIMVDKFLDAGFNYFDTAHIYIGSEASARKALVNRHKREEYTLATKLCAFLFAPTEEVAKKQLYTSLKRTNVKYIDYYLLHAIRSNNYKKYEDFHLWDFLKEKKKEGLIKHIGFSYHSGPVLLERLLNEHPEVEFVQLQINYADWENKNIQSRKNYEVANKFNKKIIVMEPVKGGALANPPKEVKKLMLDYNKDASFASYAIRFAASLDGVYKVLSGMSNIEQMDDNISYMSNFKPLNNEEKEIINKAQKVFDSLHLIECTACRYCTQGCPKQINIPKIFEAMNKHLSNGQTKEAKDDYKKIAPLNHRASDCIGCKQCEEACPQHLEITKYLKECEEVLQEE
ncbi:MAG: aldo/keto reductase [Eubacteriales bacterium]|nr:aldo/keto reductase [Eubacteriales bacterium]